MPRALSSRPLLWMVASSRAAVSSRTAELRGGPALCGNGTVDPGEFCDDGGESSSGDIDCSAARCGDGVMNVSAGEACDDGAPTLTCDNSCQRLCIATDTTCDGVDDDCDSQTDEEYVSLATTCGVGECSSKVGQSRCVSGEELSSCDPLEGALPEVCDDGLDNDCDGKTDGLDTDCLVKHPPIAAVTVTPGGGTTVTTVFAGDASATTDIEDALADLTFNWDWDGDAVFDDMDGGSTATHSCSTPGSYRLKLQAVDTTGDKDWTSSPISVVADSCGADDSTLLCVTTESDEINSGAVPSAPGGDGFSLREALVHASNLGGSRTVLVPEGYEISLNSTLLVTPSDVHVVGEKVLLTGPGNGECVEVTGDNNLLSGFEIAGCSGAPVRVNLGATDTQLTRLNIHHNDSPSLVLGASTRFGTDNEVSFTSGHGLDLREPCEVFRNRIHDNSTAGVFVAEPGTGVHQNTIYKNQIGIRLGNGSDGSLFYNNTIDSSVGIGLDCNNSNRDMEFRNNIFSRNGGAGLDCADGQFADRDYNNYWDNFAPCSGCSVEPNGLTVDPGYVDATNFDLRLEPGSPVIDFGGVTPSDLNGPILGLFNGLAPDIGGWESP